MRTCVHNRLTYWPLSHAASSSLSPGVDTAVRHAAAAAAAAAGSRLVHNTSYCNYCDYYPCRRLCAPFGHIAFRAECSRPADLLFSRQFGAQSSSLLRQLHCLRVPRESDYSCVFWHFAAFTAQHRRTLVAVRGVRGSQSSAFPCTPLVAVYAVPPMSTIVVTSARLTQCRWSFQQLAARHSATALIIIILIIIITSFLFQRLSMLIQCFNSALIMDSFRFSDADPDL